MPDDDVPAQLRRLWRLPEPAARLGRRSSLDTETVVQAAVRLADRGGLEAATLPKVAGELGVTAMSLYRHVGSKTELIELMVDAASTPPTAVPGEAAGWRAALQDWADELWGLYRERPWIVRAPIRTAPRGPNQLAWFERALEILAGTGLDWSAKVGHTMLVSGHVRQSILLTQDLTGEAAAAVEQAERERRYGMAMRDLVDEERFPHLVGMFRSDIFDAPAESSVPAGQADFHTGLTTILDGIAARIDTVPKGG